VALERPARRGLDWAAVRVGALCDLALLAPVVLAYALLRGAGVISTTANAPVIVTAVVAVVLAPLTGGFVAGRHQPGAPLTNGAAAAAVAAGAYVVFRVIDGAVRGLPLPVATLATLITVSVTFGLLGGLAGFRSATRDAPRGDGAASTEDAEPGVPDAPAADGPAERGPAG